jgi:hypothetical protein
MPSERANSMVSAGEFLADLAKDKNLPDLVRQRAKQLLRHYPSAQEIWSAGRLEMLRQQEIAQLFDDAVLLPPVLAVWPCCETFFSDAQGQDELPDNGSQAKVRAPSERVVVANKPFRVEPASEDFFQGAAQLLRPIARVHGACLRPDYQYFVIRRAQALAYASEVLGSFELAEDWIGKPALGLGKRQPCALLLSREGYALVMDLLAKIEYGVY